MNKPLNQASVLAEIHHFIGGAEVAGKSGRHGDVYNPALGSVAACVPLASEAEVSAAVEAAQKAFPAWAATPPLRRARIMFKFKELLDAHADKLAAIVTSEHGKVLSDARGEVTRGIEVVEFACGIPHLLKGEYTEQVGTGVDSYSVRQPLGVCKDRHSCLVIYAALCNSSNKKFASRRSCVSNPSENFSKSGASKL